MNKKYIRITVIAMLCAMALIVTDIILKYQHLEKKSHEISEGFSYTYTPERIMMGMKSKTDTFKVDDVTLDIYYGMYEEGDENPKSHYVREMSENVIFVIYICEYDYSDSKNWIINDTVYEDYKNIGENYFIKEISEEEVFSGDYSYTISRKNGREYKHRETITIPKGIFVDEKSAISIKIGAFVPVEGGYRSVEFEKGIKLNYEFISEDTIKIEYRHIK